MEKEKNIFEQIKKANDKMPSITLQNKKYNQVKDRIVAFRSVFPLGKITTNYIESENYVVFEAIVSDEHSNILSVAHARALRNKDKCYERCETCAIGRSLALIGFGTSESIASYEEMEDMEEGSGAFTDIPSKELLDRFNKLTNTQKANILNLNHTTDPKTIKASDLEVFVSNAK
ncbi:MAG: hypothetical protein KBT03_02890 [Bacteroidales bacterium]|nr:hypothetical protein [Candidatus Scybalousia scybalohippi]